VKNAASTRRPDPGKGGKQGDAKRMDKKKPAFGGLESIFLEEDRGDRKHDAAAHKKSPMTFRDDCHLRRA
jgi:hypothetical protein